MSSDWLVHISVITLEIILVVSLILFLFRMRSRFGLTPLYIVLGVLQPIQTILAATYFVELIPGMPVSPGSAILFTSSLFIILLIYIYQDAVEARNTVYGILTANAMMMVLLVIYGWQLRFEYTVNIFNIPQGAFYQTSLVTLLGSVVLFIDVVALLFIYEAAWGWFRKNNSLRIFSAVSLAVILDSVLFITAVYFREPDYWMLLFSAMIGKLITTMIFSLALTIYIKVAESSGQEGKSIKDVFDLLSYRQRFEIERQVGQQTESLLREIEGRFETLARISPVGIFRSDLNGMNTYVNPQLCQISGLSYEELLGVGWLKGIHPEDKEYLYEEWKGFVSEQRASFAEYRYLRPSGISIWVIGQAVPETDHEGKIIGYVGTITDITALKLAGAAIRESEGRFETLTHISPVGIFRADPDGKTNYVNPRWSEISGMPAEAAMGDGWLVGVHPDDRAKLAQEWDSSTSENRESSAEYRFVRPDGSIAWVIGRSVPEQGGDGKIVGYTGTITEITELKEAEAAMSDSEERFRYLFFGSPDAIYLLNPHDPDVDWPIVDCNLAACQMSGYSREELIGQSIYFLDVNRRTGEDLHEYLENVRKSGVYFFETVQRHKDGHLYPVEISTSIVTNRGQEMVLGIDRDISKRKDEEAAQAKRAVELETLYETSLEVNTLSDLDSLLGTIVERAASLVAVDGGSLFMLEPDGKSLRMTVEVNSPDTPSELMVPVGEGLSGRVAESGEVLVIEDYSSWPGRVSILDGVIFRRVMGVPLKVQARVIGVIIMIDRTRVGRFSEEDIRLVSLFADQAALAIENGRLYQGLQQSNLELSVAYEATIEGWSRALDLRDRETEGHTLRVTDLTLRMARKMGVDRDELVHIRRGGLLHDIGKMGVPDRILLKPDTLTEDEWEIMRKHPVFAYEMLSPVEFLRPSLDIPYSHHEKWDGTGYPRKLKGEEIPLVARIFAVADVWDALTSDRPYRPAWSRDRTLEHIRSQSGKHFDPAVVEVFLSLING